MRLFSNRISFALALATIGSSLGIAQSTNAPDSIEGRWDATLDNHGTQIAFRLDISGSGPSLKGTFYDGFKPYDGTTSASFQDGKLVLNIEHYLTTINATLKDGQLIGSVITQSRSTNAEYGFEARRHADAVAASAIVPSIAGSWIIPLDSPSAKGEKAFRFIVEQNGADVAASILRVDGDTGAFSGTYKDGKWILSHFDGSRPGVIEVSQGQDGTLEILQNGNHVKKAVSQSDSTSAGSEAATGSTSAKTYGEAPADSRYATKLLAYRAETARAKGLPEPENYETHTTTRDANETFKFNFPDDKGKLVSNEDPRFKGKVVLAIVTGTWCPNCHDEAQYLVQLDKKYRDKGLAIVALDFEEPEQQGSLERERAFVKKYGVEYTYLIAGAPSEMWEKVPQLVNLNTWPATVFIGRDGTVKGIHSGFASPASGEFHRQLQQEFTAQIERLLAEKPNQSLASATNAQTKPGE
jgi:thiol-disulfide isomerase/thioredoxin